jgi:ABC-type polysaccharide/polyol phosphate transport system ATPase subunit
VKREPAAPGAPPAVLVSHAAKQFRRPQEATHTLKERALHPFRRSRIESLEALRDVSFAVQPGEFFGVVGRNGSGKSTLLKCLAGIYRLDRGTIHVDGRMATFIELGVGFNPELAARDNIVLNGIMLGLTPREARRRYEMVLDFAELREFEDLKLKNYSSGMHVRLAFSVAIQVDADILLIDEVLAVGDAAFQQKCFDVFAQMRSAGRTILFVTHDMGSVQHFCDRALLLERGELTMIGDPRDVANHYLELNFGRGQSDQPADSRAAELGQRPGSHDARIVEAWVEDESGARVDTCRQGGTYTYACLVEFVRDVEEPAFTLVFRNDVDQDVLVTSTVYDQVAAGRFATGERAVFSVTLECRFATGRYKTTAIVAHRGAGGDVIDRWDGVTSFLVMGPVHTGGMVDLPYRTRVERGATERVS